MAEYLERGEILKILNDIGGCDAEPESWADGWDKAIDTVVNEISEAPAADVRPERHGEWIVDDVESSDGTYAAYIEAHCSQCNFALGFENGEYGWYIGDRIPFDYCPNCGAKMDVKEEDK